MLKLKKNGEFSEFEEFHATNFYTLSHMNNFCIKIVGSLDHFEIFASRIRSFSSACYAQIRRLQAFFFSRGGFDIFQGDAKCSDCFPWRHLDLLAVLVCDRQ